MKIIKAITNIIIDPGIGFTGASVLLFYNATSKVGFNACLAAFIISLLSLVIINFSKVKISPKLTLRLIGGALIITAIDAFIGGHILPAITSLMFASANIAIGESVFRKDTDYKSTMEMFLKRPDLYIVAGNVGACIMAGHPSLYLTPLLFISLIIALYNAWTKKPEYNNHPKLFISATALISGIIAFYNNLPLIMLSQFIIFITYINVEIRITPRNIRK